MNRKDVLITLKGIIGCYAWYSNLYRLVVETLIELLPRQIHDDLFTKSWYREGASTRPVNV